MKDVLRFASMKHGAPSVMMPGMPWMPMLLVDNWDTQDIVYLNLDDLLGDLNPMNRLLTCRCCGIHRLAVW